VVGYLGNRWLTYAHVGDSRLYRLRDERLQQLTSDHSMIQELVDQGFFQDLEQARQNGINEHILTHALGSGTDLLAPPTAVSELAAGDIFLFCTDGVTSMVAHDQLESMLQAGRGGLDTVADTLVNAAYDNGGVDNITLALVRVNSAPSA